MHMREHNSSFTYKIMPFEWSLEMSAPYMLEKANWILEIITKGVKSQAKNILQKYLHIFPHNFWIALPYSNKFDRGSNLKYFKFQKLSPITRH